MDRQQAHHWQFSCDIKSGKHRGHRRAEEARRKIVVFKQKSDCRTSTASTSTTFDCVASGFLKCLVWTALDMVSDKWVSCKYFNYFGNIALVLMHVLCFLSWNRPGQSYRHDFPCPAVDDPWPPPISYCIRRQAFPLFCDWSTAFCHRHGSSLEYLPAFIVWW